MGDPELVIRVDESTELRLLREEDAEALYAAVDADREHLRAFLPFPDKSQSPADTLEFIRTTMEGWRRGDTVQMGIWHEGRPVGCLGTINPQREHDALELGYWIVEGLEGRGMMQRCCRVLIDHLFKERGIHRITIRTDPLNLRSQRLAERLGFTFEGVQREACKLRDDYRDLRVYSLLSNEWSGGC